jgi:hypothetical protein
MQRRACRIFEVSPTRAQVDACRLYSPSRSLARGDMQRSGDGPDQVHLPAPGRQLLRQGRRANDRQQQRQPGQQRDGDDARSQGQARITTGVAPAQQLRCPPGLAGSRRIEFAIRLSC